VLIQNKLAMSYNAYNIWRANYEILTAICHFG